MKSHHKGSGFVRTFFLLAVGFAIGWFHEPIASKTQEVIASIRAK
jgi:hypothetical protein